MTARPDRLVVCLGTGTEIGKTWVGAATLAELRRGGTSWPPASPCSRSTPTTRRHRRAPVRRRDRRAIDLVCPAHRSFEVAMAPPMAAEVLGREPIALADLVAEIERRGHPRPALGWVETAGGVRSPIAHDGDGIALVAGLHPDVVVLVADAGLGTINAVRLCGDALLATAADVVVILNRYDPDDDLHRRNLEWLQVRDGATVVTDVRSARRPRSVPGAHEHHLEAVVGLDAAAGAEHDALERGVDEVHAGSRSPRRCAGRGRGACPPPPTRCMPAHDQVLRQLGRRLRRGRR